MTAASADLTAHLTSDEVIELTRRRRELENTVEDRRQDAGRLRAKLSAMGSNLEDPGIVSHIQHLQKQLKASDLACEAADKALAVFIDANPSEEALDALAREQAMKTRAKLHNESIGQFNAHVHAAARLLTKAQERLDLAKAMTENSETCQFFIDATGHLLSGTQACATLLEPDNWRACSEVGIENFIAKSLPKPKRV